MSSSCQWLSYSISRLRLLELEMPEPELVCLQPEKL